MKGKMAELPEHGRNYLGHFSQESVLRMGHNVKHPGFKEVQAEIAEKQGVSEERAGAILASQTRKASASAKKSNPHLKRVKG